MKRCPLQYLISEKHAHQLSAEPVIFFSELTFYRPGSPQTLWKSGTQILTLPSGWIVGPLCCRWTLKALFSLHLEHDEETLS